MTLFISYLSHNPLPTKANTKLATMKNNNQYVVIMAGGIGSRFWPFSRQHYPKQFQDVLGVGKTLIQQTSQRFSALCPPENYFVVTNAAYYELVKHQLPHLSDDQILLEPTAKNTAPCIAYAAYKIRERNPNANIIVTPSDHLILDSYAFMEKLKIALDTTQWSSKIITLGIEPTRPDTGYGYIQIEERQYDEVKKVKMFTEKPNQALAEAFIESGDFYWNAGIFVWNVQTVISSFEEHQPDMAEAFEDITADFYTERENESVQAAYSRFHGISIDYGIMEKSKNVYVVPCDCGWSDLGTWKSLHETLPKDKNQNAIQGNVLAYEGVKNCIIKTPKDRLVVVKGLENFIVAEYNNVLLICPKDEEQRIKHFLEDAKNKKGEKFV